MPEINVLLVDDEDRFRRTTQKLLEKRGYNVKTAADGLEALERLEAGGIEVVILDVRMPKMDGMSTLKRIRRDFPAVETIMLTGHGTVADAVAGVKLGAADYLTKPADIDEIVEKIESALARRHLVDSQVELRKEGLDRNRFRLFLGMTVILWLPWVLTLPVWYGWLTEGAAPWLESRHGVLPDRWWADYRGFSALIGAVCFFAIPVGAWRVVGLLVQRFRRLAVKRDELQFQLLHASKLASIGELANGIAHEVNNPLAIIVARCDIIQDQLNPEFYPQPDPGLIGQELNTIREAAYRAGRITAQLIDFGQKGAPQRYPCHLNRLLDEVIDGLKASAWTRSGIEMVRRYDEALPEISVDEIQLKQVFVNLLNNARDAITGRGVIEVTTRCSSDDIDVAIRDSGRGMTPDELRKIFRPFYTTKAVGQGTGLSLSVSLSIVESHGGLIDVQSEPGVGSTFVVSLPVCRQ